MTSHINVTQVTLGGSAGSDAFMRLEGEVSSAAADAAAVSSAGDAASEAFLLFKLCLASCRDRGKVCAGRLPLQAHNAKTWRLCVCNVNVSKSFAAGQQSIATLTGV